MAKHVFGLASVRMGPIAGDGGLGTALVVVGETALGSATMTTEEATVVDINIEESDSPVESIVSEPGKITFAWSTYNLDADNMVKIFGGTKTTGPPVKWSAPDSFIDIEQSIEITDRKGNVVNVPRAKLSAKFSLSFAKDKIGQVDIVATVLQPTKAATPRIDIIYA